MMQWFTLAYTTGDGGHQILYNLQARGCDDIERAQRNLGSSSFVRIPQSHHFHQFEIDLMRNADHRRAHAQ